MKGLRFPSIAGRMECYFCEIIISCFSESNDTRKVCDFANVPERQRARLCKGRVGNPVTCRLVQTHLNDSTHLIRYEFMFVWTPLESELNSKQIFTLGSCMEPKQRLPVICMRHSYLPSHAQTDWHNIWTGNNPQLAQQPVEIYLNVLCVNKDNKLPH